MCTKEKSGARGMITTYISVLLQVDLERVDVLLEAERGHGPEQVVPVDGLPLLLLALVARPASTAKITVEPKQK
jgi:hypothetical protein